MTRNAALRHDVHRLLEACVGGQATSRDFLAFAIPYALEDWVEPELRGEIDQLSLAADEVGLGDVGEDAFLEAAREALSDALSNDVHRRRRRCRMRRGEPG